MASSAFSQVEHPVTEWISGVNIPSCQLMIGMGIRLERMADIRCLFGKDPSGSDAIGALLSEGALCTPTHVSAPSAMSGHAMHSRNTSDLDPMTHQI